MTETVRPRLRFSGDTLLLVEFGAHIDPMVNAQVVRVAGLVAAAELPGIRDVVPAYCTVGIHFDPLTADLAALEGAIDRAVGEMAAAPAPAARLVEIPVCYGGAHGPDLEEVARRSGLTPEEVVQRHAGRTYRVYMLGFVPGFAYMAHVHPSLAMPRRRTPREKVPAGSVGITGEQTGVYPTETPGGWQLIGRTPLRMFTSGSSPSSRCQAGDEVRFVRITAGEFAERALADDGLGAKW